MSYPVKTLFVFGVYMLGLGLGLLLVPNLLLALFGFPQSDEVWIRVLGLLALYLGIYYVLAGRWEHPVFIGLTIAIRLSVILFFSAFAALDLVSPVLVLLGLPDLCSALWTWHALARSRKEPVIRGQGAQA